MRVSIQIKSCATYISQIVSKCDRIICRWSYHSGLSFHNAIRLKLEFTVQYSLEFYSILNCWILWILQIYFVGRQWLLSFNCHTTCPSNECLSHTCRFLLGEWRRAHNQNAVECHLYFTNIIYSISNGNGVKYHYYQY